MRRDGRGGLQTTTPEQADMTQPRQPLHPSSAAQIAARALAAQGEYGIVTELAREHSIRRQSVYALRERARAALEAAFTPAEPEV